MVFSQSLNNHTILKRLAKALIRLRVCAGWSEPLLVAHTTLLEISCTGSYGKCISLPPGKFFMLFCRMLIFFFKINLFSKKISRIPSECKTVWIQIRPDILVPNCLQKLSADDTIWQRLLPFRCVRFLKRA